MNNYSETKVKISLAFSILANITNGLGQLGYVQFYKPFMNYGKYYFIIDMIGAKKMYIIHHLITALLGQIIANSYIDEYEDMNLIRMWFNTEISTIFYNSYVLNNAEAVLKQVVGRYSYYQLKSETEQINQAMLDTITPLVKVAGAKVTSMLLNELNYAPEVASGMLKTQQAGALLEARTIIVEGAVKIALDAVKMLEQSGLKMTEEGKSKMVSNLLTVSVSDVDATPTISMS